jgi:DinB superfamily
VSTTDWNPLLLDQLEFHWGYSLRPRLEGLTDAEYFWEPVPDCWTIRPRGAPGGADQVGDGEWAIDFEHPPPEPAPVTTIAWRLNHVLTCFAVRAANHLGRDPVDYDSYPYAGTAREALARLDGEHETWRAGVAALGEEGLMRPCGPAEGPFAEEPLATLVLHIHREVIHHGAEICLLRDLYLREGSG